MKTLVVSLVVLVMSVFVALAIKQDNGYVLIGYKQWTIEGSLAFFAFLNLLLFGVLYLLVKVIARLWNLPRNLNVWHDTRAVQRARQELTQGLIEMSEGRWKSAEKNLVRHVARSETPLLNFLAAARSAQHQGAYERRDHYLQQAHDSMPAADVAVGLTQAELQLGHAQMEQALATLQHLRSIAPRHTHVLRLLKDLYEKLEDWGGLEQLLPDLAKRRVVDQAEMTALGVKVYLNLLGAASEAADSKALGATWERIPLSLRRNVELIKGYASFLKARGEEDRLEKLLRSAIRRRWNDALVELYGRVTASDIVAQLSTAEGWLEENPRNPILLLALGRLSVKNRLWGKARSYFEASIGSQPTAAAYRELGALVEKMGESALAVRHYKSALDLISDIPLPEELPDILGQGQLEGSYKQRAVHPTDVNPPRLLVERRAPKSRLQEQR
ncbi:MAG: heme biosynthesis protein HemY [Gammaproteobacteria bacterium]|nr:heme biosynthesis protein HemY [Gammaproteobacteria bacterium]